MYFDKSFCPLTICFVHQEYSKVTLLLSLYSESDDFFSISIYKEINIFIIIKIIIFLLTQNIPYVDKFCDMNICSC